MVRVVYVGRNKLSSTCHEAHNAVAFSLDHLKQLSNERRDGASSYDLDAGHLGPSVVVVIMVLVPAVSVYLMRQRHPLASALLFWQTPTNPT